MALQEELEAQGNKLFKYRGTLPVYILILGMVVFGYYEYAGQTLNDPYWSEMFKFGALAVCIFGLLIRVYTVGHSATNTSGRNTGGQIADELNSTGIYSMVRHPLYVGNFFMWLGPAMLTQNVWFVVAFIFLYWVYYERIMFAEEQFLRRKFGDIYLNWAEQTPAFVPRLSGFKKPKYKFLWRKVLKQEKNGILAIFVIFYLFEVITMFVRDGQFTLRYDHWLYLLIGSGVFYLLIKILKSSTRVLHESAGAR